MSMKRFVPKKRSLKKKSEPEAPPEDEQIKELKDMFDIPAPIEGRAEDPLPVGGVQSKPGPDLLDDDLRRDVFGARAGTSSGDLPTDLGPSAPLPEGADEEFSDPEIAVRPVNAQGETVKEPIRPQVPSIDLGPVALPDEKHIDVGLDALPVETPIDELELPKAAPIDMGLDALPVEAPMDVLELPDAEPIDLGLDALPVEAPMDVLQLPDAAPIDLGLDALPIEAPMDVLQLPDAAPIDLGLDALPLEAPMDELQLPDVQPISLTPDPVSLVDLGAGAPPPIEGRPLALSPEAPAAPEPPISAPGQKPGEVLDSGGINLKDIFRKKVVANPQVKELLRRHERVDVYELVDELQELARSVGAMEEEE